MATAVLEAHIDNVAVYRSGAVVTRAAALAAGAGGAVAVEGLPLALDDGSVRARVVAGNGDPQAVPLATDVRVELCLPPLGAPIEPPSEAELRAVRDEIEQLEFDLARRGDESSAFDRIAFSLPERLEDEPPRPLHAPVLREATAWVQRAKDKRADETTRLREALREARERLARLERQAAEARAERGVDEEALSKRAVVQLRGESTAPATLLLEYRVPGAAWRPCYVLRVSRDGSSAQLGVRALVTQRSGEPWERVKLAVSTADLLRAVALPELKSIRIGRRQAESARRAWRDPPRGAEALFAELDLALAAAPAPAAGAEAPIGSMAPVASPAPEPPPPPARPKPKKEKRRRAAPVPGAVSAARRDEPVPTAPQAASVMLSVEDERTFPDGELAVEAAACEDSFSAGVYEREEATPVRAMAPPAPSFAAQAPSAPMRMSAKSARGQGTSEWAVAALEEAMDEDELDDAGAPPAPGGSGGVALLQRQVTIQQTLVNYSELQLVAWDAAPGERGALRPCTWRDQLSELSPAQQDLVADALYDAAARAEQVAAFAPETCDVGRASGAFDYRYDAAAPVDVPNDGEVHNIPLLGARAEVEMTVVAVPRESDQAVRVASLRNPLKAPILEGPAEIYLDQEFLVTSRLETVPVGADLRVGLGVEEAFKVARNTHFREAAEGLLRGGVALDHEVEIEVASRLAVPVKVEVRERVPIRDEDDKEVIIEEGKVTPPWESWTQTPDHPLKGGRRWRLDLAPGASQKLRYSYQVHIDAKNELVGGNRRERG